MINLQAPEWYKCEKAKTSKTPDQELKIKVAIRMDKPMNMKHCGYGNILHLSLEYINAKKNYCKSWE